MPKVFCCKSGSILGPAGKYLRLPHQFKLAGPMKTSTAGERATFEAVREMRAVQLSASRQR